MNQLIKQDDSPILLYRPATAEEKLIIVIQTLSMRRQMLRYGPDLIAVDTTHDLTRYPGILVGTLMTIGAAGEGQPVAFFLVSAESELELSPVFHALQSRYVFAFVLG